MMASTKKMLSGDGGNYVSKQSIDTIYNLNDEDNKPFLKLICFKPAGYTLISVIKNVPNPPVLFYAKEKFDIKNVNPGLVNYVEEFVENSSRDGRAPTRGEIAGGMDPHYNEPQETYLNVFWSKTTTKKPLLSTYWYQTDVYND